MLSEVKRQRKTNTIWYHLYGKPNKKRNQNHKTESRKLVSEAEGYGK